MRAWENKALFFINNVQTVNCVISDVAPKEFPLHQNEAKLSHWKFPKTRIRKFEHFCSVNWTQSEFCSWNAADNIEIRSIRKVKGKVKRLTLVNVCLSVKTSNPLEDFTAAVTYWAFANSFRFSKYNLQVLIWTRSPFPRLNCVCLSIGNAIRQYDHCNLVRE